MISLPEVKLLSCAQSVALCFECAKELSELTMRGQFHAVKYWRSTWGHSVVTQPFGRGCHLAFPAVFPFCHSPYLWRPVLFNTHDGSVRHEEEVMNRPDHASVTLHNLVLIFGEQGS